MKKTLHITLIVFGLTLVLRSEHSNAQERRNTNEFSRGQVVSSNTGRIADGQLFLSKEEGDYHVVGIWQGLESNRVTDMIVSTGVVSCLKSRGQVLRKGEAVCSSGNGRVKQASGNEFIIGFVIRDSDESSEFVDIRLKL